VAACFRALGLSHCTLLGKNVYQAYCSSFGWIAIKFAFTPQAKIQLQNEIRFLSKHFCKHWPAYIDSGCHQQVSWLMLSLIDGISLATANVESCQLLPLLNQLESILQHIHNTGFIHGDIKPANIMLNKSTCELTVIDFGSTLTIGQHYQTLSSSVSPRFSGANASLRYDKVRTRDDYAAMAITIQTIFHHHPFADQSISKFCRTQSAPLAQQLPSRYQLLLQQQVTLTGNIVRSVANSTQDMANSFSGLDYFASV
jgi:serine/threonine protein kinase